MRTEHPARRIVRTTLDAAAAASVAAALGLLLLGPMRTVLSGTPVTVRWSHAVFTAIALAALRHAMSATPPVWVTMPGWFQWIGRRPDLADALLAFGLTRPAVLAVGFVAVVTFGVLPSTEQPAHPRHALRDLPARFDANWYAGIALDGYHWQHSFERQQNIAFFPAYPMLMRVVGTLTGAFDERLPRTRRIARLTWAGLLVALVAFVFAAWYLAALARELLGPDRVRSAVILLAGYPFAVFFSAAYTESLFLLAALGAWYHARHGQYGRAGAWGLLLGLTRPNGFFLTLPLGLIALGMRDGPPHRSAAGRIPGFAPGVSRGGVAAASMPAVGMLLFTVWLHQYSGVWFAWARVHAAWGRVLGVAAPDAIFERVSSLGLVHLETDHPYQSLNAVGLVFALSLIWPVWRHLGPAWTGYLLLNVLPPLFAGGLLSMGRLTATMFPLFLALAAVLPPRAVAAVAVLFGLLQGLVAALFYTWRDVY